MTTPAAESIMNMITDCSNLTASSDTPQYGFKKGSQIFEENGYKETVRILQDNLIRRDCMKMLEKCGITNDVWKNALAYLMFLNQR